MDFNIADIDTRVDTAYTLLGNFFEEYFAMTDSEQLIFDARHRQAVLCAKIFAILDLLRQAKNDIDALEGGEEE